VSSLQLAGGLLFAEGESAAYAGTRSTETAAGLTVYDRDGRRRYHAFGRSDVTSAVAIGRVGYAEEMDRRGRDRTLAFDLATGEPRGRMSTQLWQLLIGNAAQ
jgi:outer membrane protein assembly factor BamB